MPGILETACAKQAQAKEQFETPFDYLVDSGLSEEEADILLLVGDVPSFIAGQEAAHRSHGDAEPVTVPTSVETPEVVAV